MMSVTIVILWFWAIHLDSCIIIRYLVLRICGYGGIGDDKWTLQYLNFLHEMGPPRFSLILVGFLFATNSTKVGNILI